MGCTASQTAPNHPGSESRSWLRLWRPGPAARRACTAAASRSASYWVPGAMPAHGHRFHRVCVCASTWNAARTRNPASACSSAICGTPVPVWPTPASHRLSAAGCGGLRCQSHDRSDASDTGLMPWTPPPSSLPVLAAASDAIALALARAGHDIVIHCRNRREQAESAARDVVALGRRARILQFDVGQRARASRSRPTSPPTAPTTVSCSTPVWRATAPFPP